MSLYRGYHLIDIGMKLHWMRFVFKISSASAAR